MERDLSKYSYCESALATAANPLCIRPLTAAGPKFSGGVDTASLCGRVNPRVNGWDIRRAVCESDFGIRIDRGPYHAATHRICQRCVEKLREVDGIERVGDESKR